MDKPGPLDVYFERHTGDLAEHFSGRIWNTTVDVATVMADGALVIRFKDGAEVEIGIK